MAPSSRNLYSNSYIHGIPTSAQEHDSSNTSLAQSAIHAHDEKQAWEAAFTSPQGRTEGSLLTKPVIKTLEFRKKLFNSDLSIWHKTKWHENQEYFASCTGWRPRIPDVTLHAVIGGQDEPGPVLGVAHFRCSRHFRFGIGDPKNKPGDVSWEEMRNMSRLAKSKYEWQYTEVPEWNEIKADTHPRTRHFRWQRTKSTDDGIESRLSLRNYLLIDQDSRAVVAIFVAKTLGNVRKRGELRLFEELRPKVEMAVVLTCASISEKLNRD